MLDLIGNEIEVDDQILYATTHGNIQIGRVIRVTDEGYLKVIGKNNKRELTIKSSNQIYLKSKGYYLKLKKRYA